MSASDSGNQTLSQQRAAYALKAVKAIEGESYANEFYSHAASLPPMIQLNGFGQALAFCRSKKDTAYQKLYRVVSEWLIRPAQPYCGHEDVLAGLIGEDMSTYRLAQVEALALLDWIKRFAAAFLRSDEPDKTESEDTRGAAE